MSFVFWFSYCVILYLSLLALAGFMDRYKAKWLNWFGIFYVLMAILVTISFLLYGAIKPFEKERITVGLIKRYHVSYNKRGNIAITQYVYEVNGKEYVGAFRRWSNEYARLYAPGDTIDVTFDSEDPRDSRATFTQYWYINSDKEKYWMRIKNGEGRQDYTSRFLGE